MFEYIYLILTIGEYYQYDTIIYPELAKPGKAISKEIVIPQYHEVRKICLECFLEPTKQLLINGAFNDVTAVTSDLLHIYNCCYNQKVIKGRESKTNPVESLKEVKISKQII